MISTYRMLAAACLAVAAMPVTAQSVAGARSFNIKPYTSAQTDYLTTFPRQVYDINPYNRGGMAKDWTQVAVYLRNFNAVPNDMTAPEWEMTKVANSKYEEYELKNVALRAGDELAIEYYSDKGTPRNRDTYRWEGIRLTVPGEKKPYMWGKTYNVVADVKDKNEIRLELVSGLPPFVALEMQDYMQPHRMFKDYYGYELPAMKGMIAWILHSDKGIPMRSFSNNWMLNSCWPPRNTVYFTGEEVGRLEGNALIRDVTDKALSSDMVTFRYDGKAGAASTFTAMAGHEGLVLDPQYSYARYTINNVWLSGEACIFTGFGTIYEEEEQHGNHAWFGLGEGESFTPGTSTTLSGPGMFSFGDTRYVECLELYIPAEKIDGMWHAIDGIPPTLYEPVLPVAATLQARKSETARGNNGVALTELNPLFNTAAFPAGYTLESWEINREQLRYAEWNTHQPRLLPNTFNKIVERTEEAPTGWITATPERAGSNSYGGYLIYRMDYTLVNDAGDRLEYAAFSNPVYIEDAPLLYPGFASPVGVYWSGSRPSYTMVKVLDDSGVSLPLREYPYFDLRPSTPFATKANYIRHTSSEYPEATWNYLYRSMEQWVLCPDIVALGEWVDEVKAAFSPNLPYYTPDTDMQVGDWYKEGGTEAGNMSYQFSAKNGRPNSSFHEYVVWSPEHRNFLRHANHTVKDVEYCFRFRMFPAMGIPSAPAATRNERSDLDVRVPYVVPGPHTLTMAYNEEESRRKLSFDEGVDTVSVTLDSGEVLKLPADDVTLRSLAVDVSVKYPNLHATPLDNYDIVTRVDILDREGNTIGNGFEFIAKYAETDYRYYTPSFRITGLDPRPEMNPTIRVSQYFIPLSAPNKVLHPNTAFVSRDLKMPHYLPNAFSVVGKGKAEGVITRVNDAATSTYALRYDDMPTLTYSGDMIHNPGARPEKPNLNPSYWHIEATQGADTHSSLEQVYNHSNRTAYAGQNIATGFDATRVEEERITITPLYLFERNIEVVSLDRRCKPYNSGATAAPQRAPGEQPVEIVALRGRSLPLAVSASEDTPTGIDTLEEDAAPAVYYTIQGIRVAEPQPGNIYIVTRGTTATKELYL